MYSNGKALRVAAAAVGNKQVDFFGVGNWMLMRCWKDENKA